MAQTRLPGLLAACSLAAASCFMVAAPAYAANVTDTFELDGNVTAGAKDDWSTVNFGGGSAAILARTGVTADPAPQSIYAGGGSKDDLDLNGPLSGAGGWKYKSGSVPDKDNITNAYAVAYNVNNELVIYAGADRFDNSGNAFMGFWFFQNEVSLGTGGGGGGAPFIGQHAVGDTLVLANFVNGGTTVNIEVLQWVGTGGNVNGTLQRIAGIAGGVPAKCGVAGTPDAFCGITNSAAGEAPPWAYLNKDGNSTFQVAGFLELGINISQVFAAVGGAAPCFSSFLAETRASSSVDAILKDFALHSFPVCGIAVSKVCKSPVLVSNTTIGYTIEGRVQNTGFGTLNTVTLTDNPAAATAFERFACNGNLPTGPSLGGFGTGVSLAPLASACYRSTFNTTVNGQDDVVTASATAGSATVTAQAGADCPNLSLSPLLNVTKSCSTTLAAENNRLVVKVDVAGEVCNTGDSVLLNVSVTDTDVAGNLLGSPQTLAVNTCKSFTASYFPSTADNQLNPGSSTLVPGLAKFSDTVTATATAPLGFQVPPDSATAECTLCPGGVCTSPSTGTQTKQFRLVR